MDTLSKDNVVEEHIIGEVIIRLTEECPYGWEDCYQDDYESMCDDCKVDRAESIWDMRQDMD